MRPANEMLVILMRHAIAEDSTPDEARALTQKGRRRASEMAELLGNLGLKPHTVLCSPRTRAIQTAEIVCHDLKLKAESIVTPALDFGASWDEFASTLAGVPGGKGKSRMLLAVGHQPHLGMMATVALAGEALGMELRKGSCLGLRFDGDIAAEAATLEFYLTPRLARGFF